MPERFRPYFAAYLVLYDGNQVLLHKRKGSGYYDGSYGLVSGHFEGGETAREAIMREAQEEAGITLNPKNLRVVHVMHRYTAEREYIDVYLTATEWQGMVSNLEPEKCGGLDWFPFDDLPDNVLPEVRQALTAIERKECYSEFGWEKR